MDNNGSSNHNKWLLHAPQEQIAFKISI